MAVEKPADTRYPIHDLLKRRWSPLAFADRGVETDKLQSLLEAWRWAPSSFNEQPWALIMATRVETAEFEKLLSCLTEGNRKWAQSASVLMLTVAKLMFDKNGKLNRHAFHDIGLAAMSLTVQATQLGLHVHQMAGIVPEHAREIYAIPTGWEPLSAIAVGYLGDMQTLPPDLRDREMSDRSRRSLKDFVFSSRWGNPSGFVG